VDADVLEVIQGAIAFGNTCVVILADDHDYQLIDTVYGSASCLPKGVVNIVRSKDRSHWISLVKNMEVKSLWHAGMFHKLEMRGGGDCNFTCFGESIKLKKQC